MINNGRILPYFRVENSYYYYHRFKCKRHISISPRRPYIRIKLPAGVMLFMPSSRLMERLHYIITTLHTLYKVCNENLQSATTLHNIAKGLHTSHHNKTPTKHYYENIQFPLCINHEEINTEISCIFYFFQLNIYVYWESELKSSSYDGVFCQPSTVAH